MVVEQGQLLWQPSPQQMAQSGLAHYMDWLGTTRGRKFDDYQSLWQWSATDLDGFWRSVWDYFDIQADGDPSQVLGQRSMPGAQWFPGTQLNYAEHIFRNYSDQRPAIIARCEAEQPVEVSWAELRRDVAALAAGLRSLAQEFWQTRR